MCLSFSDSMLPLRICSAPLFHLSLSLPHHLLHLFSPFFVYLSCFSLLYSDSAGGKIWNFVLCDEDLQQPAVSVQLLYSCECWCLIVRCISGSPSFLSLLLFHVYFTFLSSYSFAPLLHTFLFLFQLPSLHIFHLTPFSYLRYNVCEIFVI